MTRAAVALLVVLGGCTDLEWVGPIADAGDRARDAGSFTPPEVDAGAIDPMIDPPPPSGELDRERARARYVSTTDLVRYVFAPSCAAQQNECHHSEDFPDLHTEANVWSALGLGCNQGIGERPEVEDFCERRGDEIVITDGVNEGFSATIGAIVTHTDEDGAFERYEVRIEGTLPMAQSDASFRISRLGMVIRGLGGGSSAQLEAGAQSIFIDEAADILDPGVIVQGDENGNGVYGDGRGAIIVPGDARASYMVRRLFGLGTERVQMPLGVDADNPTEVNPPLTRAQMWVLMSWINCMDPADGPYGDIGYDCPENADNDGTWR